MLNICNEFEIWARNETFFCYFLTTETHFLNISMSFQPCSSLHFLCQTFRDHFAVIVRQTKSGTTACFSELVAKIPHTHTQKRITDAGGRWRSDAPLVLLVSFLNLSFGLECVNYHKREPACAFVELGR